MVGRHWGFFVLAGCLDIILNGIRSGVGAFGFNTRVLWALPTAFMKPLSGSGARAMMLETMNTTGRTLFPGRVAATLQGKHRRPLFYVLPCNFGSVGIRKTPSCDHLRLAAGFRGIVRQSSPATGFVFAYNCRAEARQFICAFPK